MASGPFRAPAVVALVAGALPGWWSVSAGSATEVANVAATFAAVQQKLNPRYSNDGPLSRTPADESCAEFANKPGGCWRSGMNKLAKGSALDIPPTARP